MAKARTTTRSYTLGLEAPGGTSDRLPVWQRLFNTHLAVCSGAREFGELLLTLRGGLGAELAVVESEEDADRKRLLLRGVRRMLALGWLSVEDADASQSHKHRIAECGVGASLHAEHASDLLRAILAKKKVPSSAHAEWIMDCAPALTASIRPDAVWVNRSAAFDDWRTENGDKSGEMVGQAHRILFTLCGDGFVSLALPAEELLKTDGEHSGEEADYPEGTDEGRLAGAGVEDDAEPSTASRGIFGDLFGGDPKKKIERATAKGTFSVTIGDFLRQRPCPTRKDIEGFRSEQDLPPLDPEGSGKFPAEVKSSGAPTTTAKRYRKLLVSLGMWPVSADEDGTPRKQAESKHKKSVDRFSEATRPIAVNAADLSDACPTGEALAVEGTENAIASRVFTPIWAPEIAARVAAATKMPVDAESQNEFKRLMLALAARRLSQTQSWTKINELERHKAAVREDAARAKLQELDPSGSARKWLTEYEGKRGDDSNATTEFRVTNRMIGECEVVFKKWQGSESAVERDELTAEVQKAAEKFGDSRLYSDIAASEHAAVLWRDDSGALLLKQWVKFRQAEYDQRRGKIPRFCHPDAFLHPTWCEFGGSSKPGVWYLWSPNAKPQKAEPGGEQDGSHRMWLKLPNLASGNAAPVPLRWRSKRLSNNLGGIEAKDADIPRSDRVSIAAAGLPTKGVNGEDIQYRPALPFLKGAKGWNARLQLDRRALADLSKRWDRTNGAWRDGGTALRSARWFVTFAPALGSSPGPGRLIHPKLGWKSYPHSDINKRQERKQHAQLILSRLPGLRVLSVDLGHRYAAACAVWESMSSEQMKRAASGGKVLRGGIGADHLFAHIETPVKGGKPRTGVYRRVGADTLPDGSQHPTPWTKLERQFLIKLQGEDVPSRMASNDERGMVARWEHALGLTPLPKDGPKQSKNVADLMARGIRLLTLAGRRHNDRARIAHNLIAKHRTRPGGVRQPLDETGRVELLTETLALWHDLFGGDRWTDAWAANLWKANGLPELALPARSNDDEGGGSYGGPGRKAAIEEYHAKLRPHAERLLKTDLSKLSKIWADRWNQDDQLWEYRDKKSGLLREIRQWITPRGLRITDKDSPTEQARKAKAALQARHVGGVSMERINTLTALYRLLKSYKNRPDPDNLRKGVAEKGDDSLRNFHLRLLDVRDRLREQRVKQLASRITEAALGIGRIEAKHLAAGVARPAERKDAPCHAVVIESLTNYRPDELQTRRENRQLMEWSSAKVQKYLSESCQLHGLHLREVQPNYTSRQCSRTGAPGVRGVEASAHDLLAKPWWKKDVARAKANIEKAKKDGRDGARSDHLFANAEKWALGIPERDRADRMAEGADKPFHARRIILPRKGGDLFVSASAMPNDNGRVPALQADLNAAANIGLRALLDPDWSGKWWWVPCTGGTYIPAPDRTKGADVFKALPELPHAQAVAQTADINAKSTKRTKSAPTKETKAIENRWRHVSANALQNGEWQSTGQYWAGVERQICGNLNRQTAT